MNMMHFNASRTNFSHIWYPQTLLLKSKYKSKNTSAFLWNMISLQKRETCNSIKEITLNSSAYFWARRILFLCTSLYIFNKQNPCSITSHTAFLALCNEVVFNSPKITVSVSIIFIWGIIDIESPSCYLIWTNVL